MRAKAVMAAVFGCVSFVACAQTTTEPPVVTWEIDVVRDGTTIDTFDGTTPIGQAAAATHHHETVHRVGCKQAPAASIDLVRSLTVSPVRLDAAGVTLAIEAQDTIEDDTEQRTPDGCPLPPEPRRLSASHPGLVVPSGQWTSWTILESHPALVYRVRASVASH